MSSTTRRVIYGLVATVLLAAGVLLVVFLGLSAADQLASVIGMIAGVGSMLLAIVALRQAASQGNGSGTTVTMGSITDSTVITNPTDSPMNFTTNYHGNSGP